MSVLIVCRMPDPHVRSVREHLASMHVESVLWDLNTPESFQVVSSHGPDGCLPRDTSAIWWRYKATSDEYQGIASAADAFATREWLAYFRACAAQRPDLLWVNNPVATASANLKLRNLSLATREGFRVPETIVSNCPAACEEFAATNADVGVIYKPLTYYYEAPDIATFTTRVMPGSFVKNAASVARAPVLLQRLVEKQYELRVTIVGNNVLSVRINSQSQVETKIDWRRSQALPAMYQPFALETADIERLRRLHARLGLAYGAYDLIVDRSGELVFLEVNPGGQWLWLEEATGVPISRAVATLLACRASK